MHVLVDGLWISLQPCQDPSAGGPSSFCFARTADKRDAASFRFFDVGTHLEDGSQRFSARLATVGTEWAPIVKGEGGNALQVGRNFWAGTGADNHADLGPMMQIQDGFKFDVTEVHSGWQLLGVQWDGDNFIVRTETNSKGATAIPTEMLDVTSF